jgi:hypothetical protein
MRLKGRVLAGGWLTLVCAAGLVASLAPRATSQVRAVPPPPPVQVRPPTIVQPITRPPIGSQLPPIRTGPGSTIPQTGGVVLTPTNPGTTSSLPQTGQQTSGQSTPTTIGNQQTPGGNTEVGVIVNGEEQPTDEFVEPDYEVQNFIDEEITQDFAQVQAVRKMQRSAR